jgi:threonine aldolase
MGRTPPCAASRRPPPRAWGTRRASSSPRERKETKSPSASSAVRATRWWWRPTPIQLFAIPSPRGILTAEQVSAAVNPADDHAPHTRMLVVENTHNRGGGAVWPLDVFRSTVAAAHARGLAVHLDGARLWNAEAATGTPVRSWAELCDSATVCFSKGLGAPVGSVLVGKKPFVQEARRLRKRLGGGMRQAGILAAGALYALEHHVSRLVEDHRHARALA